MNTPYEKCYDCFIQILERKFANRRLGLEEDESFMYLLDIFNLYNSGFFGVNDPETLNIIRWLVQCRNIDPNDYNKNFNKLIKKYLFDGVQRNFDDKSFPPPPPPYGWVWEKNKEVIIGRGRQKEILYCIKPLSLEHLFSTSIKEKLKEDTDLISDKELSELYIGTKCYYIYLLTKKIPKKIIGCIKICHDGEWTPFDFRGLEKHEHFKDLKKEKKNKLKNYLKDLYNATKEDYSLSNEKHRKKTKFLEGTRNEFYDIYETNDFYVHKDPENFVELVKKYYKIEYDKYYSFMDEHYDKNFFPIDKYDNVLKIERGLRGILNLDNEVSNILDNIKNRLGINIVLYPRPLRPPCPFNLHKLDTEFTYENNMNSLLYKYMKDWVNIRNIPHDEYKEIKHNGINIDGIIYDFWISKKDLSDNIIKKLNVIPHYSKVDSRKKILKCFGIEEVEEIKKVEETLQDKTPSVEVEKILNKKEESVKDIEKEISKYAFGYSFYLNHSKILPEKKLLIFYLYNFMKFQSSNTKLFKAPQTCLFLKKDVGLDEFGKCQNIEIDIPAKLKNKKQRRKMVKTLRKKMVKNYNNLKNSLHNIFTINENNMYKEMSNFKNKIIHFKNKIKEDPNIDVLDDIIKKIIKFKDEDLKDEIKYMGVEASQTFGRVNQREIKDYFEIMYCKYDKENYSLRVELNELELMKRNSKKMNPKDFIKNYGPQTIAIGESEEDRKKRKKREEEKRKQQLKKQQDDMFYNSITKIINYWKTNTQIKTILEIIKLYNNSNIRDKTDFCKKIIVDLKKEKEKLIPKYDMISTFKEQINILQNSDIFVEKLKNLISNYDPGKNISDLKKEKNDISIKLTNLVKEQYKFNKYKNDLRPIGDDTLKYKNKLISKLKHVRGFYFNKKLTFGNNKSKYFDILSEYNDFIIDILRIFHTEKYKITQKIIYDKEGLVIFTKDGKIETFSIKRLLQTIDKKWKELIGDKIKFIKKFKKNDIYNDIADLRLKLNEIKQLFLDADTKQIKYLKKEIEDLKNKEDYDKQEVKIKIEELVIKLELCKEYGLFTTKNKTNILKKLNGRLYQLETKKGKFLREYTLYYDKQFKEAAFLIIDENRITQRELEQDAQKRELEIVGRLTGKGKEKKKGTSFFSKFTDVLKYT